MPRRNGPVARVMRAADDDAAERGELTPVADCATEEQACDMARKASTSDPDAIFEVHYWAASRHQPPGQWLCGDVFQGGTELNE